MANYTNGADALAALNATNEGGGGNSSEFTSFSSGTSFKVRVIGKAAVQLAYGYSIYKKVNSFVAKNPATRDENGYVTGNPTPWDKASEFYRKQSKQFQDAMSQEAYKYAGKPRFAMAFVNLADGETIIVDLSKAQALAVSGAITKYEKKLDKLAFELSKEGTSTNTKVSLTPIIDMDEDLTDKERANFAKGPTMETFDHAIFNGIWFEQDETQMVALLRQAGFDVTQIGYSAVADAGAESAESSEDPFANSKGPIDVSEDDLPF